MKMRKIGISDINDFIIGNAENTEAATGCTVIICPEGATGGVDVRGGGPATRETDLLKSENTVQQVNAVVLSGGSAFGLEAASGVARELAARDIGFKSLNVTVPIVCGASLFDLGVGQSDCFPDVQMGIECVNNAFDAVFSAGNHGAGTGATVGKLEGMERSMKTGLGTFACSDGYVEVGAIAAVNAIGDIYNGAGNIIAGLRTKDGNSIYGTIKALKNRVHSKSDDSEENMPEIPSQEMDKAKIDHKNRLTELAETIRAEFYRSSSSDKQEAETAYDLPAQRDSDDKGNAPGPEAFPSKEAEAPASQKTVPAYRAEAAVSAVPARPNAPARSAAGEKDPADKPSGSSADAARAFDEEKAAAMKQREAVAAAARRNAAAHAASEEKAAAEKQRAAAAAVARRNAAISAEKAAAEKQRKEREAAAAAYARQKAEAAAEAEKQRKEREAAAAAAYARQKAAAERAAAEKAAAERVAAERAAAERAAAEKAAAERAAAERAAAEKAAAERAAAEKAAAERAAAEKAKSYAFERQVTYNRAYEAAAKNKGFSERDIAAEKDREVFKEEPVQAEAKKPYDQTPEIPDYDVSPKGRSADAGAHPSDDEDYGYDIHFNTTISCLVTNAKLTKPQANKLASILHDAYARAIKPVHSSLDGDTIFVLASGKQEVDFDAFAALATDVMQYAVIDGAVSARGAYGLPAARDL